MEINRVFFEEALRNKRPMKHGGVIGRAAKNGGNGLGVDDSGVSYTLTAADRHAAAFGGGVRRLLPVECERLQGFPDNHTIIDWMCLF